MVFTWESEKKYQKIIHWKEKCLFFVSVIVKCINVKRTVLVYGLYTSSKKKKKTDYVDMNVVCKMNNNLNINILLYKIISCY